MDGSLLEEILRAERLYGGAEQLYGGAEQLYGGAEAGLDEATVDLVFPSHLADDLQVGHYYTTSSHTLCLFGFEIKSFRLLFKFIGEIVISHVKFRPYHFFEKC